MAKKPLTRRIKLTQGFYALVDAEDYERVNQYRWTVYKSRSTFYATSSQPKLNGNKSTPMHRFIMRARSGRLVDHANRNGLDNRKSNLRFCLPSENSINSPSKKRKNCSSRFKGVWWREPSWCAGISSGDKTIHLGSHAKERDAAKAYNKKALELYGRFAWLNKV